MVYNKLTSQVDHVARVVYFVLSAWAHGSFTD